MLEKFKDGLQKVDACGGKSSKKNVAKLKFSLKVHQSIRLMVTIPQEWSSTCTPSAHPLAFVSLSKQAVHRSHSLFGKIPEDEK